MIILSLGIQSEFGISSSVVSEPIRQTNAVLPSQLFILGSELNLIALIFKVGFHFAASKSSLPGSDPTGVHDRRKYFALVTGTEKVVLKPAFCQP